MGGMEPWEYSAKVYETNTQNPNDHAEMYNEMENLEGTGNI